MGRDGEARGWEGCADGRLRSLIITLTLAQGSDSSYARTTDDEVSGDGGAREEVQVTSEAEEADRRHVEGHAAIAAADEAIAAATPHWDAPFGIEQLLGVVRSNPHGIVCEQCVVRLREYAMRAFYRKAIAAAGGVSVLVHLVASVSATPRAREEAAAALYYFTAYKKDLLNRRAVVRNQGIALFVALVKKPFSPGVRVEAAAMLANLACEHSEAIAAEGGVTALVELAKGGSKDEREEVANALYNLHNPSFKMTYDHDLTFEK